MNGNRNGLVSVLTIVFVLGSVFVYGGFNSRAQSIEASPSNWLYPKGNPQGTKKTLKRSWKQDINDFVVKWENDTISGDLTPLIGNVISNSKLIPSFPYGPNEIAALIGGKAYVVDATGKTHTPAKMPPFSKDFSVMFDTLSTGLNIYAGGVVSLGVETIESENLRDSLSYAYVCSFDHNADTVQVLKRLAVDLRDYDPNIFGSLKPFFGRSGTKGKQIYASFNMSKPAVTGSPAGLPPYFRGVTQFNSTQLKSFYPFIDIGDDANSRTYVAPEVNRDQPSVSVVPGFGLRALPPCLPSVDIGASIEDIKSGETTQSSKAYLFSFNMSEQNLYFDFKPYDLSDFFHPNDSRPKINPYFVNITDAASNDSVFILSAVGYTGVEGSSGTPYLHLFDVNGNPISAPLDIYPDSVESPSYEGGEDHLWSVAVGDVDGQGQNALLPSYPNYQGNEILVTQSTREFVVPSNKLIVLRYYSGSPIPKKSPPNKYLNSFDTVCTQRINGWLAAVNDIDGDDDRKDEVFLADGSKLRIMRMFDYETFEFRSGSYFDTVKTFNFQNETIQNVAVSDLEGDGYNDIIVTTNRKTYLIGRKRYDIIRVISPSQRLQYCVGDTVHLAWENIFFRHPNLQNPDSIKVKILFRPYSNGVPGNRVVAIDSSTGNLGNPITYDYIVDSLVYGFEGRFIIARLDKSGIIRDSSAIVDFRLPEIQIDALSKQGFEAGERISVSGTSICLDTVELQYSYDLSEWNTIAVGVTDEADKFNLSGDLPCAPYYSCLETDPDSLLYLRASAFENPYADFSSPIQIKLKPERFPFRLLPCESSCPSVEFVWNKNMIKNMCDTVIFAVADINSSTFSLIGKTTADRERYVWDVPEKLPERIKARFCCENSCVRNDTILRDLSPSYIGIVAPNPFSPPFEELTVNYRVPKETNVTIRIYDQANRLVKELIRSRFKRPGTVYCATWNGKIWDGSLAANGMYYLALELSDGQKEVYPIYVKK